MAPAKKNKAQRVTHTTCAENRKARHNYFIDDNFEVGIMLTGTEVKSLRAGQANIAESFAEIRNGEAWLVNAHIQQFDQPAAALFERSAVHPGQFAEIGDNLARGQPEVQAGVPG